MAITVTESFNTGPVTLDDRNEVRVREWEIKSTDPVADDLFTEADVAAKLRTPGNILAQNLPRIGDTWESHGTSLPPVESIAQPAELDVALLTSLRCVGGRITKIGTPGAAGISAFHYTAQFSTRSTAWDVTRSFEITSRSKTLYHDLDATIPSQGVSQAPIGCESWTSINVPPFPTPPGHWGEEINVRGGEGIDILEPVITLVYRQLIFAQSSQDLLENITANILTTNEFPSGPDFDPNASDGFADHWLFAGVSGGEIRDGVYDMSFKFLYDDNRHRPSYYRTDPGSGLPKLDANNVPICRSYRGYQRSNWAPLMSLFTFP